VETAAEIFAGVAALAARAQALGLPLGAPLVAVGVGAAVAGTRLRRVLGAAGLAGVGALAGFVLRGLIAAHLGVSTATGVAILAGVGAVGGALAPGALPFAVAALPGAIVGTGLPLGGRPEYGAAAGALAAGLVGLLLARVVTAAVAGLAGALAVALGALACFPRDALARELALHPAVVIGFTIVVGIAGAALQLAGAPTSPAAPAARSPESPP
jgi:hypothetical protein